jgi:hypothetical protein
MPEHDLPTAKGSRQPSDTPAAPKFLNVNNMRELEDCPKTSPELMIRWTYDKVEQKPCAKLYCEQTPPHCRLFISELVLFSKITAWAETPVLTTRTKRWV